MKSAGMERDEERLALIAQVKELKGLSESKLRKIIDCLEEESYEDGQCIFRQGLLFRCFNLIINVTIMKKSCACAAVEITRQMP